MKSYIFTFSLILYFVPLNAFSSTTCKSLLNQSSSKSLVAKEIQERVAELQREMKIPALALSYFTPTQVQGVLGLGEHKGSPIDPQTSLFNIGSIAKVLTVAAINKLVDQGHINLQSPITDFEGALFNKVLRDKHPELIPAFSRITLANLLEHNSGITMDPPGANIFFDPEGMRDGVLMTQDEFVLNVHRTEFIYEPGQQFKYSNLAFIFIKQIIESVNPNQDFIEYMRANVLIPLGITQATYNLNSAQSENLVFGHGALGSAVPFYENSADINDRTVMPKVLDAEELNGAVGANLPATALAKLGQELLSWTDPEHDSKLIQDQNFWIEALKARTAQSSTVAFSRGIMLKKFKLTDSSGREREVTFYGHTGSAWGFKAIIFVSPELNWGFAAQFNAWETQRETFLIETANILLKHGIIKFNDSLSDEVETWLTETTNFIDTSKLFSVEPATQGELSDTPAELAEYIGSYYAGGVGFEEMLISADGKLIFMNHELVHEGGDKFRWPKGAPFNQNGEPLVFTRNAAGKVDGLIANWALKFTKAN